MPAAEGRGFFRIVDRVGRSLPRLRLTPFILGLLLVSLVVAPLSCMRVDVFYFYSPWAGATFGGTRPWGAYQFFSRWAACNYPPFIPYLLALAEWCRVHLELGPRDDGMVVLLKLPGIFAHAAGAVMCGVSLKPLLGARRAVVAGVGYVLCLPLFVNAAWWGQYDDVLALAMLGSMLLVLNNRPVPAGLMLGWTVAIKLQGLCIAPLLLAYAWSGADLVRLQDARAGWCLRRGLSNVLKVLLPAALVWIVLAAPFLLAGVGGEIRNAYFGALDFYPGLSHNALNVWQLVQLFRLHVLHLSPGQASSDQVAVVGAQAIFNGKHVGLGLYGLFTLLLLVGVVRRPRPYVLLLAVPLQALGFCMLLTQVHQRYLVYPAALAVPLAAAAADLFPIVFLVVVGVGATFSQVFSLLVSNRQFDNLPPIRVLNVLNAGDLLIGSIVITVIFCWAIVRFVAIAWGDRPMPVSAPGGGGKPRLAMACHGEGVDRCL